ncbi:DUF1998 domain-containing protein [Enterococcus alishanensis]|nr:DUF1998 domain-containing protein [Enterococcus alishanensis]
MVYDKTSANPEFNVRRSQLLTPFGIGALMDINNQSVMVADSEYWNPNKCEKVHDIRLETEMNANGFIEPPVKEVEEIVGTRFPSWYFSPKDRSLRPISSWRESVAAQKIPSRINTFDKHPYDSRFKGTELVPVRVICACKNGHAQEFPWLEWPHPNMSFDDFKGHKIKLESVAQTGSIADLIVRCETCNKGRSLGGVFDEEHFPKKMENLGIQCKGQYKWKKSDEGEMCSEGANLRVLLKNANNFFFPNISSSVNIPFKRNKLMEEIQRAADYSSLQKSLKSVSPEDGIKKLYKDVKVQNLINFIAEELGQESAEIKNAVSLHFFEQSTSESTGDIMDYRRPEFEVLTGKEGYDKGSERLKIKIFDQTDLVKSPFKPFISKITLVHQLEVVSALRSYSRIEPTDSELMRERALEGEDSKAGVNEVSLKREDGYYVGMRSLGEGIFFSLDSKQVDYWLKKIKGKPLYNRIVAKEKKVRFADEVSYIRPEYYLLHTLSHLLIRELNMSSGYSSSALKERIYYSNSRDEEMYGVLIYTSSSDSEGTLGGLVKQGVPERFFALLSSALEKAQWCSFDPVCIESDSQGRDSLNASACHACSLISETSCEKMNVFLDRGLLIGTMKDPELGFFSKVMKESNLLI